MCLAAMETGDFWRGNKMRMTQGAGQRAMEWMPKAQKRRIKTLRSDAPLDMNFQKMGCGLVLGCLVNQFHELVELGSDDDLCAAVAQFSSLCVVVAERIVLATTACSEALGIHAILVLQRLHHAGGTQTREVPVVADVLA